MGRGLRALAVEPDCSFFVGALQLKAYPIVIIPLSTLFSSLCGIKKRRLSNLYLFKEKRLDNRLLYIFAYYINGYLVYPPSLRLVASLRFYLVFNFIDVGIIAYL